MEIIAVILVILWWITVIVTIWSLLAVVACFAYIGLRAAYFAVQERRHPPTNNES